MHCGNIGVRQLKKGERGSETGKKSNLKSEEVMQVHKASGIRKMTKKAQRGETEVRRS